MVSGTHVVLYSSNPEADRVFFRDVLGFRFVLAGATSEKYRKVRASEWPQTSIR
jgi:catechol 2,3-dioxygenase-like lactoylglutathione lyase family enzyme